MVNMNEQPALLLGGGLVLILIAEVHQALVQALVEE